MFYILPSVRYPNETNKEYYNTLNTRVPYNNKMCKIQKSKIQENKSHMGSAFISNTNIINSYDKLFLNIQTDYVLFKSYTKVNLCTF